MTEREFQQRIVQVAGWYRWKVYHTYDSRRSEPGFPDLILCRPPELLAVEVKAERGRLSHAQREWLDRLGACGVECRVVRPVDWPDLLVRLQTRVGLSLSWNVSPRQSPAFPVSPGVSQLDCP